MVLKKRNVALTTCVIGMGSTLWGVSQALEVGLPLANAWTATSLFCTLLAFVGCWRWGISRDVARQEVDWGWGVTLLLLLIFAWEQWWQAAVYALALLIVLTLLAAVLRKPDAM